MPRQKSFYYVKIVRYFPNDRREMYHLEMLAVNIEDALRLAQQHLGASWSLYRVVVEPIDHGGSNGQENS